VPIQLRRRGVDCGDLPNRIQKRQLEISSNGPHFHDHTGTLPQKVDPRPRSLAWDVNVPQQGNQPARAIVRVRLVASLAVSAMVNAGKSLPNSIDRALQLVGAARAGRAVDLRLAAKMDATVRRDDVPSPSLSLSGSPSAVVWSTLVC
jgi:hypothetical protein